VALQARPAKGVRAADATTVGLRGRHWLQADAAGVRRLSRGFRHCVPCSELLEGKVRNF
jgi:hypothetical protein